MKTITKQIVKSVLSAIEPGLSAGMGEPIPGKMCVEAAVCYAMGEPHGDRPSCVARCVRNFKVNLNDAVGWPSKKARAAGMKQLAIAQLGSWHIPCTDWQLALAQQLMPYYGQSLIKFCKARKWGLGDNQVDDLIYWCNCALRDPIAFRAAVRLMRDIVLPSSDVAKIEGLRVYLNGVRGLLICPGEAYIGPSVLNAAIAWAALKKLSAHKRLVKVAEMATQALVQLKTEGSKFLYLVK